MAKAKREGEELVKVGYRLPPRLIKLVEMSALDNRRSINDEMIVILEEYFSKIESITLTFSATLEQYNDIIKKAQELGVEVMPAKVFAPRPGFDQSEPGLGQPDPEPDKPAKKGKK